LGSAASNRVSLQDFYRESAKETTVALVGIAAALSSHYAKSRLPPAQLDVFLLSMGILGFASVLVSVVLVHNGVVLSAGLTLLTFAIIALLENHGSDE
jgi:hypothetical protein